MKLHGSLWRGAAVALLFLLLINTSGFSQSDSQSDTQAELQAAPPGWKIETIDDGHIIAELGQRSLAYGPDGVPHVAYGADHLYHAYRAGGNWIIDLVDSTPQVGKNASIAVDSLGHVYITYYDELNQNLKYATNWQGWWEVSTLASNGNVGSISFIFASWGGDGPEVNVGYLDSTGYNVWFTYLGAETSGFWAAHEVIDGPLSPINFSMTMWGVQPRFSIYAGGSIYYGYYGNGAWQQEQVDSGLCSSVTAIAVDSAGTPYIPISYRVGTDFWETYLAYKGPSGWVYPTQEDPSSLILTYGYPPPDAISMSYDPGFDQVFLAMQLPPNYESSNSSLVIMRGLKHIWEVGKTYPNLLTNVPGDRFPAISVELSVPDLKAGVAYLYGGALQYQFLSSMNDTAWNNSISPVDTSSDIGKCAVARVDNTGNVHLMYYRSDTGELLYKVSTATGWSITHTITNPGEWATCNSFAQPGMDLDSNGKPQIAFVNFDHQLIYSKWSCVGRDCFTHSVVDTGLDFGLDGSAAIAMVTGDKPYILYHKNRILTLAYDLAPAVLDWTIGAVPGATTTYGGISLETDNDSRLHAGFVYDVMDDPYYARFGFGGNIWSGLTILDSTNYAMYSVSLAVSPKSNTPQVAYVNNLDQLILTAYSCPTICFWLPNTIDAPPDEAGTLGVPSLIIDSSGHRLLAYDYHSPQQGINGLKFMKIEGAVKTSQIIETISRVDSISLALRPGNVPVIAYHVPAFGQIKVAWGPVSVFLPLIRR